jgi:formamidopyrimidine-DNA glycosylase
VPELPEVETVRRGLQPVLEGRVIARVEARRPDLRFPLPERFAERLEGARVERLGRRAKYLVADLDTGQSLLAHLGMSGRFTIAGGGAGDPFYFAAGAKPAHTHVTIETDHGVRIEYNDPRRFGYMALAETASLQSHGFLSGLGPEPLGPEFTGAALAKACAGRRAPIKAALLDQRIVAGLGNIYVCEALFRSGIAPTAAAGDLSAPRLRRLVANVKAVLSEAIEAGGSSLRDYAQADGALGYFQHRFKVYDREGEPCPACAHPVQRLVQSGRSTFFCARCQR